MLERLLSANGEAEVWWDALPSAHAGWHERVVPAARVGFRDPDDPARGLFTGATSNLKLVWDHLAAEPDRWAPFVAQCPEPAPVERFASLYDALFRHDAAMLHPLWEASGARHGWVCAQLWPQHTHDEAAMMAQAMRLAAIAPNVMVKVPASAAGLRVIEALTARGVATNATLSFTVAQAMAGLEAVQAGLARRAPDARPIEQWRAVHTFMAGRLGQEPAFAEQAAARGLPFDRALRRWAEMAVFKRIHQRYAEADAPMKALLCSLQIDDGACFHLAQSAGAASVFTMPPGFLSALDAVDAATATGSIDEPPPADVLAALGALPYFHEAYDDAGAPPEAFGRHPAFRRALDEQTRAYDAALAWVASIPASTNQEIPS